MIKWSEWSHDYTDFSTGHLHLAVDSWDGPFRWRVTSGANLNYLGTDSVGVADTLDAAKSAAEAFAREWIAAQASALGDGGEWTSVLPNAPGYYWYRIPAPDEDSLEPDTWTDVRLQLWNRPALIGTLGCSVQFWSVPVEPPPLPEVTDES